MEEALDLALLMSRLGCTEDDIANALDALLVLLAEGGDYRVIHCSNGVKVRVERVDGEVEFLVEK